jgi:predicted nucleic acid-binding protein
MLLAMEFPVADDTAVMHRATRLAVESGQPLFDTLYHAVALESEAATLITADERYRRKAQGYGRIVALARWED